MHLLASLAAGTGPCSRRHTALFKTLFFGVFLSLEMLLMRAVLQLLGLHAGAQS